MFFCHFFVAILEYKCYTFFGESIMRKNIYLTFGERLKKCRIQRKETQEELAQYLKVNRTSVFRYENGNMPNLEILKKIAMHYNTSLDYFCELTDYPVKLDKIKNLNDISNCVKNAKELLGAIEIQHNLEIDTLLKKKA